MTHFISNSAYFNQKAEQYDAACLAFQHFMNNWSGESQLNYIMIAESYTPTKIACKVSINSKTDDETLVKDGFTPVSSGEWSAPDKWNHSYKYDYYAHSDYPAVIFFIYFSRYTEAEKLDQAF